jgi:AraC family transcriptional regulator of adaptative response / DNA-3-methyladenine glycosylase II
VSVVRLEYRAPFAWEPLIGFLHARAIPEVEVIADDTYLRTARFAGRTGWLRVAPIAQQPALQLEVSASLVPVLEALVARVRHVFDLDADPDVIAAHLQRDRSLRARVARMPGLRVPGALDGFELAMRAVLGQQVSVRAATTFAGRIARAFGEPIATPHAVLAQLSPAPERIANASVEQLTAHGITRARAQTLRVLAQACVDGRLRLEPGVDADAVATALQALPGIGPWTAQYVAMRALGAADAFPEGDLGLRRALGDVAAKELRERAEKWRPYRAYAALHLWHGLQAGG